jgi:hypothetical protein
VRRAVKLVVACGAALVLAGCTLVPTAQSPSTIAKNQVGFELQNKTIPGTDNGRVRFLIEPIYIVDASGHLAPSSRLVASPVTLASVLRELLLGPTLIESSAGYSSALPKDFVLVSATISNKLGLLDIATPLSSLSRKDQILALGQLVLTAYGAGATSGIEITVAGAPTTSLLPSGARALIITRSDFASLLNA